jgi:hypothetical protein
MPKKKPATRVTITIVDNGARDGVNVSVDFDPPLTKDGDATPSQQVAVRMLENLSDGSGDDQAED